MKNGSEWVGYYYDGRDEHGKRKEIPLGGDLNVAKAEWAKLDCKPISQKNTLLGKVFDRYEAEIIPAKMPRTQKDNLLSLTQLRKAFSEAPINAVTPQVIAQYRDKRTGKVRANREISLLSHKENPASGVRSINECCLAETK